MFERQESEYKSKIPIQSIFGLFNPKHRSVSYGEENATFDIIGNAENINITNNYLKSSGYKGLIAYREPKKYNLCVTYISDDNKKLEILDGNNDLLINEKNINLNKNIELAESLKANLDEINKIIENEKIEIKKLKNKA